MNEREEFLEAIRRRPEDDAPRLLFADWLEERGDALGEFIRVECALAAMPAGDPQRDVLERRDRDLTAGFSNEILAELRTAGLKEVRFRRGFADRMHIVGTRFVDLWRPIARLAPLLRALMLRGIPAREGGRTCERLMSMPCFAALRALDLSDNAIELPAIEALVGAPRFAQVETLHLSGASLGGSCIRALLKSSHLGALRTLHLSRCGLSVVDAQAIGTCRGLISLESLALDGNAIGDEGFAAVAASKTLGAMKSLSVAGNGIGAPGLTSFANVSAMTGLTALNLSNNPIGDDGAAMLASSSSCGRLRKLEVSGCGVSSQGMEALRRSPWLANWERPK